MPSLLIMYILIVMCFKTVKFCVDGKVDFLWLNFLVLGDNSVV